MKKFLLANFPISIFISIFLLLIPWNLNFAKSDCIGNANNPLYKNLLIITPCHPAENSSQEIVSGIFPFDDLIIKI